MHYLLIFLFLSISSFFISDQWKTTQDRCHSSCSHMLVCHIIGVRGARWLFKRIDKQMEQNDDGAQIVPEMVCSQSLRRASPKENERTDPETDERTHPSPLRTDHAD